MHHDPPQNARKKSESLAGREKSNMGTDK
jgi:hypothetical protein